MPEALLINVAYFCDNGGLSAIREAFQDADPASLPFSLAHHLINIVTQVRNTKCTVQVRDKANHAGANLMHS